MKISPTNAERPAQMSDVAMARNLITEIAGDCWDGKIDMLDRVYDAICRHFHDERRPHQWTRRRVRAFWHREAAGVRYHEMVELAAVAAAEKARRERIDEARRDHAAYVEHIARMATALSIQDEEFHREAVEAFRGIASQGVDRQVRSGSGQGARTSSLGASQGGVVGAGASL